MLVITVRSCGQAQLTVLIQYKCNKLLGACVRFNFVRVCDHHRQHGSDCTVLTATSLVNKEWQILTPYRIETPKPIDKKFCTSDYVWETMPCAKFGANPSTSGKIGEI